MKTIFVPLVTNIVTVFHSSEFQLFNSASSPVASPQSAPHCLQHYIWLLMLILMPSLSQYYSNFNYLPTPRNGISFFSIKLWVQTRLLVMLVNCWLDKSSTREQDQGKCDTRLLCSFAWWFNLTFYKNVFKHEPRNVKSNIHPGLFITIVLLFITVNWHPALLHPRRTDMLFLVVLIIMNHTIYTTSN